jgi:membrane associated rhomboid family serine protease
VVRPSSSAEEVHRRHNPATYGVAALSIVGFGLQLLTTKTTLVFRTDAPGALWTWLGHLFGHAGTGHLAWNVFVLLAVGRSIERAIGTKRFLGSFLAIGVLTGVVRVLWMRLLGLSGGVLGFDYALLGVLVVAARFNPRLGVRSRSIPVLYAVFVSVIVVSNAASALGVPMDEPRLSGVVLALLLGLGYGVVLRRRGVEIPELRVV